MSNSLIATINMDGGTGGALPSPIIWLGGPGPLNNNLAKNSNFFLKVEISDFMYLIIDK